MCGALVSGIAVCDTIVLQVTMCMIIIFRGTVYVAIIFRGAVCGINFCLLSLAGGSTLTYIWNVTMSQCYNVTICHNIWNIVIVLLDYKSRNNFLQQAPPVYIVVSQV